LVFWLFTYFHFTIFRTGALLFFSLFLGLFEQALIDAVTIKETYWFRDKSPWLILDEVLLPQYIRELRQGKRTRVRIWSAACSTGQEPYSTVMCIDQHLRRHDIKDIGLTDFEILATDISPTVLKIAQKGSYDSITVSRGLNDFYRNNHFKQEGRFWTVEQRIKDRISFQHFNLRQSFILLGNFDLILCRYVTICFVDNFSREVLNKMAAALNPEGVLLLGNSEIFSDHKERFLLKSYKGGVYYLKRNSNSKEGGER